MAGQHGAAASFKAGRESSHDAIPLNCCQLLPPYVIEVRGASWSKLEGNLTFPSQNEPSFLQRYAVACATYRKIASSMTNLARQFRAFNNASVPTSEYPTVSSNICPLLDPIILSVPIDETLHPDFDGGARLEPDGFHQIIYVCVSGRHISLL